MIGKKSLGKADVIINESRNQWGVTAIDTLSTAIIMGETQTVEEILDFVPSIDFTTTKKENESVSVFESNIRYLGGLLSGELPDEFPLERSTDCCQAMTSSLGRSAMS